MTGMLRAALAFAVTAILIAGGSAAQAAPARGSAASAPALAPARIHLATSPPCARPGYTTDKPSPQQAGTPVGFDAFVDTFPGEGVPNCTAPLFRFWLRYPAGSWVIARDWGAGTYVWNTAAWPAGGYTVVIWVKQAGTSPAAGYDTSIVGTYTIVPAVACASATLNAGLTSPQPPGTAIVFTATAALCSQPLYQFFLQYNGGAWHVARAFSTDPTWTWKTQGFYGGPYRVVVWAVQNGAPRTTPQAYADAAFTLTLCATTSVTPAPASPQLTGTPVQLTAAATGCVNPVFEFWLLAPGSQTWRLARTYAADPTYVWATAGLPSGTYRFSVWSREAGGAGIAGNSLGRWDSVATLPYTVTRTPVCWTVSATAVPAAPQPRGTPVTISATATGCPNPQYEFWYRADRSSTWQLVQPYSANQTYAWDTSTLLRTGLGGTMGHFSVWARDSSSPGLSGNVLGTWDSYNPLDYWVNGFPYACTGLSATFSPPDTAPAGSVVVISAAATPCANPLYEFWILAPGSQAWQRVQAYGTRATYTWNTAGLVKGRYSVIVMTRDATSMGIGGGDQVASWDTYLFLYYTLT